MSRIVVLSLTRAPELVFILSSPCKTRIASRCTAPLEDYNLRRFAAHVREWL